jgi:uncharacterized protein
VGAGYVGILRVELHFPEANSLKGKRKFVKSAKAQLQNRFGVSVAEVEHHDLWQRSQLIVACAAREHHELERLMAEADRYLSAQDYELVWSQRVISSADDHFSAAYTQALELEGIGWEGDLDGMRRGDPIEEL